jgi:hypothetical protein
MGYSMARGLVEELKLELKPTTATLNQHQESYDYSGR